MFDVYNVLEPLIIIGIIVLLILICGNVHAGELLGLFKIEDGVYVLVKDITINIPREGDFVSPPDFYPAGTKIYIETPTED